MGTDVQQRALLVCFNDVWTATEVRFAQKQIGTQTTKTVLVFS